MQQEYNEDHVCPICLTVYFRPTLLKSCKHCFCGPCIEEATHLYDLKKCPLCRKAFGEGDKQVLADKSKEMERLYPEETKIRVENDKQRKFYRLEVGNTTQILVTNENNKYRWCLYVKPAPGEQPLSQFVDTVEVNLHPTFNPPKLTFKGTDVIKVQRLGWGTFDIQIKINWHKKYGGFAQVTHYLEFKPKVGKVINCKLGGAGLK